MMEGAPVFPRRILAPWIVFLALGISSTAALPYRPAAGPSGILTPPYSASPLDSDSPPDGLFDFLFVNLTIDVAVGGEFLLIAQLTPSVTEGRWFLLDAGSNPVQVPVDGHRIRESGQDGPYTVNLVLEANCRQGCQVIDTDSFTTGAFQASQFEGPDFAFAGAPQDFAIDTDTPPDGLYDLFAVVVPVAVAEPGEYSAWTDSFVVGTMRTNVRLAAGTWGIVLSTPGWVLRQSGVQGPISLTIYLSSSTRSSPARSTSLSTEPYDSSQFADPPARVAAGARDAGVDTDTPPDGRFDVLSFVLPVSVKRSGEYRVSAYLQDTSGGTLDIRERVLYLSNGSSDVEVRFRSHSIAQRAVDGPYEVAYSLLDASYRVLGFGRYTTAGYRSSQFDPPLLGWAGPVQDSYIDLDTPPDGLYDRYEVHIPVTANESGYYSFLGVFDGPQGQIMAWNLTLLPPGTQVVNLSWSTGAFTAQDASPSGSPWIAAYVSASEPIAFQNFVPSPPPGSGTGNGTGNATGRLSGPWVSVSGPPEIQLPDLDGDGLHDSLDYVLPVNVTRAGPYAFSAMLTSAYNNLRVSFATSHRTLSPGHGTVRLSFPGWAIRASGLPGPYTVFVQYREGSVDPLPHEFASQLFYSYTPALLPQSFEDVRPSYRSAFTSAHLNVDGVIGPNEWPAATTIDLATSDPGIPAAHAMLANDLENVYITLDVVGDRTNDDTDAAAIAFDVLLPDDPDPGFDAQVGVGFTFMIPEREFRLTAEARYDNDEWYLRQAPFDSATPERWNLSGAIGFGPSPSDSTPHRIYEFRIPLTILGATPGEEIGFAVYSLWTRGIRDGSGPTWGWPVSSLGLDTVPLNNFPRLLLAGNANLPPDVIIASPPQGAFGSGLLRVEGSAADPERNVERVDVRIDTGAWQLAAGTASWTFDFDSRSYPDGPHTIVARSFDGQDYSAEATVNVVFDNTAPTLNVTAPTEGTVLHAHEVSVQWSATDALAGLERIELSIDGGTPVIITGEAAQAGSHRFGNLPDGPHSVKAVAVDHVGNSRTLEVAIRIDTNPLSPNGPYGPAPLFGIGAGITIGAAVAAFLFVRSRRVRIPPPGA